MRAAVPAYVGSDFGDCPPGHRFGLYFPVWTNDWRIEKEQKSTALKQILRLPTHSQDALLALGKRQALLLNNFPAEARLTLEAKSSSPFATGLGMEHPLENGFAFLNPHGLPYLPGSGVKGVLRRASQELNWDEATKISPLFGRETENQEADHLRGALTFWDVLPKPAGNTMEMDVMTPHQGHYYQWKKDQRGNPIEVGPHDSGQPTPIVFLVVPAGSEFSFHVTCDTARLPEDLRNSWQDLLRTGFAYAFDWLGFGAKTAVGYGAMAMAMADSTGPNPVAPQKACVLLRYNPGSGEIWAELDGKKSAPLRGEQAKQFADKLGVRYAKLKKNKELKGVAVQVQMKGNEVQLIEPVAVP